MAKAPRLRLHLWISGRVQGVFYRGSTETEARRLGVKGWVRNLEDGRVEVTAEGPEEAVRALAEWCRKGPPGAWVQSVDEREETATGEFREFRVTYTR